MDNKDINNNNREATAKLVQELDKFFPDFGEIKKAIDAGANINASTHQGYTALIVAVDNKQEKLALDTTSKTAIVMKAMASHIDTDIALKLIEAGANVNAADNNDATALMTAASVGQKEIVQKLIEKNADVNVGDRTGEAALTKAIAKSCTDIALMLIERGASVNAADNNGVTTLMLAVKHNQKEIAFKLIEAGAKVEENPRKASDQELNEVLKQYDVYSVRILSHYFNKLFYDSADIIKLDKYGIYKGGEGHDTFIVYPKYEGKKKGYKLVIGDFNFKEQDDYIDLQLFSNIKSFNDIMLEEMIFNHEPCVGVKAKESNDIVVILMNQNKLDLTPENFLIKTLTGEHQEL